MKRKILMGIVAILIIVQFIRPTRNEGTASGENEVTAKYQVPDQVKDVLVFSCYDCHSNHTNYPWYTHIQPIGWWLQSHVNDGKRHLNFSEIGTYAEKKAKHKFEEIEDAASNHWMPLGSYLFLHPKARLTEEQSKAVAAWAAALK